LKDASATAKLPSAARLQDAGRTLIDLLRRRRPGTGDPPAPDLPARLAEAATLLNAPAAALLQALAGQPKAEAILDVLAAAEGGLQGLLALRAQTPTDRPLEPALRRRLALLSGRGMLRFEHIT
jgi:hypothetical protein